MKKYLLITAAFLVIPVQASTNRSVLSVKISDELPPGFCVVTRSHLGKFGHYVTAGNVSTFGSMAGGSSSWGNTSDTGVGPTKINVDVASISSEIEIKPIAAVAASASQQIAIDGESGAAVAMVNSLGLPVDTIGGTSSASWLGSSAGSAVIVHNRDASTGDLTVKSTHHFNGTPIKILLTPGKYTFFVAPGFAFSAADTAKAFKWHHENKGKHWPFELLCVAKPQ